MPIGCVNRKTMLVQPVAFKKTKSTYISVQFIIGDSQPMKVDTDSRDFSAFAKKSGIDYQSPKAGWWLRSWPRPDPQADAPVCWDGLIAGQALKSHPEDRVIDLREAGCRRCKRRPCHRGFRPLGRPRSASVGSAPGTAPGWRRSMRGCPMGSRPPD